MSEKQWTPEQIEEIKKRNDPEPRRPLPPPVYGKRRDGATDEEMQRVLGYAPYRPTGGIMKD